MGESILAAMLFPGFFVHCRPSLFSPCSTWWWMRWPEMSSTWRTHSRPQPGGLL